MNIQEAEALVVIKRVVGRQKLLTLRKTEFNLHNTKGTGQGNIILTFKCVCQEVHRFDYPKGIGIEKFFPLTNIDIVTLTLPAIKECCD